MISNSQTRRGGLCSCLALALAAGCSTAPARDSDPGSSAERRALEYLARDVPAWPRENGCFSCHNNGDAARALYTALQLGRAVPSASLRDTTAWLLRPADWEDNKGDPGFSDRRLANLQFAAALVSAIEAGEAKDRAALALAAKRVAADQDADGSWRIDEANPVGSPATYGTVLATAMAAQVLRLAEIPDAAAALRKAERWLAEIEPKNAFIAASVLLGQPSPAQQQAALQVIGKAQSSDGGWGPYADAPAEAFDTALVLLGLSRQPGTSETAAMIRRGRDFLTQLQELDGSWPETTRPAGNQSYAQRLSTTGWATLALLRTKKL